MFNTYVISSYIHVNYIIDKRKLLFQGFLYVLQQNTLIVILDLTTLAEEKTQLFKDKVWISRYFRLYKSLWLYFIIMESPPVVIILLRKPQSLENS